jgi:hypothetical protein
LLEQNLDLPEEKQKYYLEAEITFTREAKE